VTCAFLDVTLFPQHRILRFAAAAWLLAALAMLAAMLLRPELQADERRALSSLVPLYFLSLPLGHAGLMGVNQLKTELYLSNDFVPGILTEGLLLWILLTALGYMQWFLLVPWVSRSIRQLGNAVAARLSARKPSAPR
jgi:hypothetical protein